MKSGIGMYLLQKMGWKQGEGLGKNKEGPTVPLMLDFKTDRKGKAYCELRKFCSIYSKGKQEETLLRHWYISYMIKLSLLIPNCPRKRLIDTYTSLLS